MRTHSIDLLSENIKNIKSREYFKEVVRSYYTENYRSSVVMLYSIVICDLVYKLQELKDQYNDVNSKNILTEIERLQTLNPHSPDWENKLIELIKDQTNILEHSDHQNILHLQKHRHLCAHPVLMQNYELYSPNKETVRAHIVNILEGLLTKPALLSKKIFDDFLNNLNDIKDILVTEKDIEIHLKSKYFENLNIAIEKDIFRSLWKIVFKLDNQLCNDNRIINYKALKIILNRNYTTILDFIESDKAYFSNNLNYDFFDLILSFLNENPIVYKNLNDSAKTYIKNIIENNDNYKFTAWFLNETLTKHLKYINEINDNNFYTLIKTKSIIELYNILENQGYLTEAKELLIKMYCLSRDFDQADKRFDNLIEPFLENFTINELTKIVEGTQENGQINGRRKAKSNNRLIKKEIDKLNSSFDFSPYNYFEF
jgi:hypothetical protein